MRRPLKITGTVVITDTVDMIDHFEVTRLRVHMKCFCY